MDRARQIGPGAVVAICFFIAALEGYDIQAFGVAAPQMAPALKLGPLEMGWAGSAAMIGLVIGAILGGTAADRFGRKPVLALSVAAFGIFSVATSFVQNGEMLILMRLMTGIGFGGAMPNLIAIATEISPPERRAATTTSMFCGLPAGGSLVALLAGYGGELGEWRMIFLIGGLLPLLLTPVIIFLMPETRPQAAPETDRRILRGLFAENRALATLLIWVIFALDLLVTYLLLNWLPTLVVAKGFAPHEGATASLWLNGASVVGALILGRIADRMGYRWPLVAIFVGLAFAVWALAQASGLPGIFAASAATGFLVVGGLYVLYALAPAYYPPQIRAAGAGTAIAVGRFGSIVGPLIAGELRALGYTPSEVFMAMLPAAGVTAVAVFALTTFCRTYRED